MHLLGHDADRVHRVYLVQTFARTEYTERHTSVARYLDLWRWTHDFSALAAFGTWHIAVGDGDATRELPVMGASAAYLTVSEIFPLEVRAQAIAVFFAIAQCFGAIGPIFYGVGFRWLGASATLLIAGAAVALIGFLAAHLLNQRGSTT